MHAVYRTHAKGYVPCMLYIERMQRDTYACCISNACKGSPIACKWCIAVYHMQKGYKGIGALLYTTCKRDIMVYIPCKGRNTHIFTSPCPFLTHPSLPPWVSVRMLTLTPPTSPQLSDTAIATAINERSVHVLVNLNGWITGHRSGALVLCPAPVQVVYKDFPKP